MSWVSLPHTTPGRPGITRLPVHMSMERARQVQSTQHQHLRVVDVAGGTGEENSGLGAACAGTTWRWAPASATTARPDAPRVTAFPARESAPVAIPADVLRAMREAARTSGRSESEVWAEAAREWLSQRRRDDGPLPPTPAAAALAIPRRTRSWSAIDALLADLRQPQRIAAPGQPAA